MNSHDTKEAKLSSLASTKIAEILDVIIYKVELDIHTKNDKKYIDLPFLDTGYPGISDSDAYSVYKMLTKEFENQGFKFPVQGIERTDTEASWTEFLIKLKKFREQVLKLGLISKAKTITNLIIVASDSNDYAVIINEDYGNPISADKAKPSWKLLYEIAENKEIEFSDSHKSNLDYFNTNKSCKLYTQTGLALTKILKREHDMIKPSINIKIISDKAYRQRINNEQKHT